MIRIAGVVTWQRLLNAAVLLLAASGAAGAETIDRGVFDESALPAIERDSGFIVDRTVTHFGAEFVRQFAGQWRTLPETEGVNLSVIERPSARYGSVIFIEHRQRALARVFLYAGRSGTIGPLARAAARFVARRTSDAALSKLLFKDPDLAGEELQ